MVDYGRCGEIGYEPIQMIERSSAVVVVQVVNVGESWKTNTMNNGGVIIQFIRNVWVSDWDWG